MSAPRERKPGEVVFTTALLAASTFLLWKAFGISGFQSVSSAGMFPMLAALTMVVTGCLALAGVVRHTRASTTGWAGLRRDIAPPELVAGAVAVLAYMLLLEFIGFLLASWLFLVLSMRLFGSRRWWLNAVVGTLSLVAIHGVFRTVFSVVLPKGSLWVGLGV